MARSRNQARSLASWQIGLLGGITTILLLALVVWFSYSRGMVQWVYHDGHSIHQDGVGAPVRRVLWRPPSEVTPAAEAGEASGSDEIRPSTHVPVDVRLLVSRKTLAGDFDLFVKERSTLGWAAPRRLVPRGHPLNSEYDEVDGRLSTDGRELYFASNRPGGLGGFDLYSSRRSGTEWGRVRNLGIKVNSPFDDRGPTTNANSSILVFSTTRPQGFLLSPPEDWDGILLARRGPSAENLAYCLRLDDSSKDLSWGRIHSLTSANSSSSERDAEFSPVGDFLYFSSNRPGGSGGFDLYRGRCLVSGAATMEQASTAIQVVQLENVGSPLNSTLDDLEPTLFLEGFGIAYRVQDETNQVESRFESRSREVDAELKFGSVPLTALRRAMFRIGILLASGVTLIVGGLLVLRYRKFWTISLIARCAALAIVFHIAMLYGFYFLKVSRNLAALSEKDAPTEVSVESLLQAKINLEVSRLTTTMPETAATPSQVAAQPTRQAPDLAPVEMPSIETVLSLTTPRPPAQPPELTVAATLLEIPPQARGEREPAPVDMTPQLLADPTPTDLPAAEPVPMETEVSLESDVTPPSSIRQAEDAPRPGVLEAHVAVKAPTAEPRQTTVSVEHATTPVKAPVPPRPQLPPQARSDPEPAEVVTELPVPAQSPQTNEATVELAAARTSAAPATTATATTEVAEAPTTRQSMVENMPRSWEAPPMGIRLTQPTETDARELATAPFVPPRAPPPLPGSRVELPDPAPVAELAAESGEEARDEVSHTPSARPQEKVAPADVSMGEAVTMALLEAAHATPAARPQITANEATASVKLAAPLELASAPRPGAKTPIPRPFPPTDDGALPRKQLPEGDGGQSKGSGTPELADVLNPSVDSGRLSPSANSTASQPTPAGRLASTSTGSATAAPGAQVAEASAPTLARLPYEDTSTPRPPHDESITAKIPEPTALKDVPGPRKLPELPPDIAKAENLSEVRSEASREVLVERLGGTEESEAAVSAALAWLSRHQSAEGFWDVDGFDAACRGCRSPGIHTQCDSALTALVVLCFLGQNHSPDNAESPYRWHVRKALDWLISQQREDGLFSGADQRFTMYGHGMVTLAMSEAYLLTKDERLRPSIERAARIITRSQNPTTGGWRYKPKPPLRGDTSITGWQVLALTSLRDSEVELSENVFDLARHWLDVEVSSGAHRGIYGYTKPSEPRLAMVAEGMYARQLLGSRIGDRNLDESARYIYSETRRGGHLDNLYLIYYGTLALYHYQGWIWEKWNQEVRDFLVRTQHPSGKLRGSWDPTGPWSSSGGRVLSTALATLSLEVYYRYLPLYWRAERGPAKR